MEPTMPIASPPDFSVELAEKAGRFYTQGFPADQKGLSHGVLTDEEYFAQAKIVLDENFAILDVLLSQFDDGLLFFYFSSIDQNCHMLWRLCDPTHPQYRPDAPPELKESIKYFYRRMDEALGKTLEKVDSRTRLVVLSDHGFTPFTREFHANTWLHDAGILRGNAPLEKGPGDLFSLVDWDNTRAYGLGFNGIYLNLKGREPNGVVDPADADREIATIIEGLQKVVDPVSGQRVIRTAFNGRKEYVGPYAGLAPDIVMGFNTGYRTSDDSVLGKLPLGIVGDRTDKWAADHCYDPATVPGILLSNDPVREGPVAIWDLAPSILQTFGVAVPPEMEGGDIFLKA
jgi:predicted AlkP superfamily phosphohydrolase/phosphomutase